MSKDYVVGNDGVRVRLISECLDGWVKPKNLEDLQTYASKELDTDKFHGPRWIGATMQADLLKQVLGTIHEFPKMETAYSLYYSTEEKKWAVKVPEQNGSGASVSFYDDGKDMPEGYALLGSIHTHPEMGAFWSGTDLNDQQFKHGLHIVFGLRNGLVSQIKCTVFFPSQQEDQDIKDVLEDVDFTQVYEPVPEWVETIKRQSYRKPTATVKVYGNNGAVVSHRTLPAGHYKPADNYAGYTYDPDYGYSSWYNTYRGSNWYGADWYGSRWYGGWSSGAWESDYADDITGTTASEITVDSTKELKNAILDALNDSDTAAMLVDVFTDPAVRGPLEMTTGIMIVDSLDKTDVLISIEDLMTGETVLKDLEDEEARQLFEGLMDLRPDFNIVDKRNALGNDINVESLCYLLQKAASAYSDTPCVSDDTVNTWLTTLKQAYETILAAQAEHANPKDEEEEEC